MKRFSRSTNLQTLLFPKSLYSAAEAKAWAKAHGFHYASVEGKGRSERWHVRQHSPSMYREGTFRTILISGQDGVEGVVGVPKLGTLHPHEITVRRSAYRRKGYTTKRGTHVGPEMVHASTFQERGGYGSRGPRKNPDEPRKIVTLKGPDDKMVIIHPWDGNLTFFGTYGYGQFYPSHRKGSTRYTTIERAKSAAHRFFNER